MRLQRGINRINDRFICLRQEATGTMLYYFGSFVMGNTTILILILKNLSENDYIAIKQ